MTVQATTARVRNRTHRIVHDLGVAIVTGAYGGGRDFPTEAELCRQFDVSRSVLREAVKMLTAKGLLGSRAGHGTWVQPETAWNLLDSDVLGWQLERPFSLPLLIEFTQIRLSLEPGAAALAAVNAGSEDRRLIADGIGRMIAAHAGRDDPLESDIAFHAAVMTATGNRFYAQLKELIATALRFSVRATNSVKGVHVASVGDHQRIADAVIRGDAAAAEASMRALILEALHLMRRVESQADAA